MVRLGTGGNNWSLKIKILRILWMSVSFIYWPVFPKFFSPVRVFVARVFGAKIGKKCLICPGVKIWIPWNLCMMDFVSVGHNFEIYNFAKITIGSNTSISQNVFFVSENSNRKFHNPLSSQKPNYSGNCDFVNCNGLISRNLRRFSSFQVPLRGLVTSCLICCDL